MKKHEKRPQAFLAINSGSSSIKFALFGQNLKKIVSGCVHGIGTESGSFEIKQNTGEPFISHFGFPNHASAGRFLLDWLDTLNCDYAIAGIGHRLVHGGPAHWQPTRLTAKVLAELEKATSFDPEHLPDEIPLAKLFLKNFPRVPQFACFDTAFHHDLPLVARMLPIPRRYFKKGIRRYGFHGLSCAFLLKRLHQISGPNASSGRVIIAHLGNGSSITAIKAGKSIDTSMSLTSAAGIPMGSRAGDLDPGLAAFLLKTESLSAEAFQRMVTNESGLLGISELSSDMRILMRLRTKNSHADQAISLFCYQAKKCICSMAGALSGVDTLIFSGGIGENYATIRSEICAGLEFLGLKLDRKRNQAGSPVISRKGGKVALHVIKTDEEQIIAEILIGKVKKLKID